MTQQCAERPQQSNNKVAVSIADMGDLQTKVADACGVGASLVQDIAPATPVQKALVSSNRDLGLWVLSLTFSCQNVGLARLETIVETIRSRNPILRARTVQIGSEIYTAVIDDQAIWETSSNLSRYLGQVTGVRIPYGSPQVRYAFIDDVDEGTHFVITTTHATQDLWTRKLLYEELQTGLEDIRKLQKSPTQRPSATLLDTQQTTTAEKLSGIGQKSSMASLVGHTLTATTTATQPVGTSLSRQFSQGQQQVATSGTSRVYTWHGA
jgi:hypothetical protein